MNYQNNETHKKFIIPVGEIKPQRKWWQFWKKKEKTTKEQINDLIEEYKEDISWGEFNGEVVINGEKFIPFKKEMWFPSPDYSKGSPDIETIGDDNLENNDEDVDTEQNT